MRDSWNQSALAPQKQITPNSKNFRVAERGALLNKNILLPGVAVLGSHRFAFNAMGGKKDSIIDPRVGNARPAKP
jgi:hypothetical protein